MSVQNELNRLTNAKNTLSNWLKTNGYTVSSTALLDALCNQVSGIKLAKYRTGSGQPSDSVGSNDDLYFEI